MTSALGRREWAVGQPAQTFGVIIKDLRSQEPLNNSSSALIAAFGGIAYEIVLDMVLDAVVRRRLTA